MNIGELSYLLLPDNLIFNLEKSWIFIFCCLNQLLELTFVADIYWLGFGATNNCCLDVSTRGGCFWGQPFSRVN